MDEAEESEEMAALVALDELKAKYGSMMTAAEYKKRKKAILASFSGQMFATAPAYRPRAKFIWRDVNGMTNVKGKDFKEVRAKMKGDFKSDPDCRSGMLANFKSNSKCVFARRLAIIDGKERRYRMVLLNSGNFCFQVATDLTKTDSDEEDADDDEEEEDDDDEEDDAPAPAPAPAPVPKSRKGKRAPEKPPAEAEEEAGPSTGGRPQRARKQPTK